jgi:cellulose biosynthesis protein BcsQ
MESKKLSEVVKENVGRPTYDYLLIDCPPTLSLLTINALVAADAVLILVKTDPGAGEENPYPPQGTT